MARQLYPWQLAEDFGRTDDEIAVALVESEGDITAAAEAMQMRRNTLRKRVDKSPMLLELCSDLDEQVSDIAERNVRKDVKAGDPKATKFWLMTRGKDRGFVTRVESTGKDGKNFAEGMEQSIGRALDSIASRVVTPGATPSDPS